MRRMESIAASKPGAGIYDCHLQQHEQQQQQQQQQETIRDTRFACIWAFHLAVTWWQQNQ